MIVTSSGYDQAPPALTADDLVLTDGYMPLSITALVPLRGARADLEIYVLVDNSSNWDLGERFIELRKFLDSQPPTTSIGIAYIQDGRLEVTQRPTRARERALLALRPPSGSAPSNPFRALAELIEGWQQDSSRHVVLMITNGVDPVASGLTNATVDADVELAQRAGVIVYGIYHPGADYKTSDLMTVYSGQVQLAHLAIETGGSAAFQDLGPSPSFGPFLAAVGDDLANQYLLEFVTNPEKRGALQNVTVASKLPDVHISAPWRVWVPASPALRSDPSAKKAVAADQKNAHGALGLVWLPVAW